jgi:hypothetical protein
MRASQDRRLRRHAPSLVAQSERLTEDAGSAPLGRVRKSERHGCELPPTAAFSGCGSSQGTDGSD